MTEQRAFLPAVSEEPHLTRDIHIVVRGIVWYFHRIVGS